MSNRAAKYEQLHKSLKKHFKSLPEPGERSVLEHLLYACCLEDAKAEQADEAFAKLQQAYFDWNEVRVTTVIELAEALASLPNPTQAGHRIKRCLQSLFEARYQYDIDDLKKANLSKATDEITLWKGISPFILNYVSQNALGGHAIPADTFTFEAMVDCEILTPAEAEKRILPGVERAIPKNKGGEFASLLHQFAVELHQQPKSAAVIAVFKDLGVTQKAPVDKAVAKKDSKASVAPSVPASLPKSTETVESSKKAEAPASKKSEKASSESSKPKDSTSKTDAKTEKAPELKKKVEPKADAKVLPVKKGEVAKADIKPPAKEDKAATKKPAQKSSPKETKKPNTTAKTSKPVADVKKLPPSKKVEAPAPTAKKNSNTSATKKKPR